MGRDAHVFCAGSNSMPYSDRNSGSWSGGEVKNTEALREIRCDDGLELTGIQVYTYELHGITCANYVGSGFPFVSSAKGNNAKAIKNTNAVAATGLPRVRK